jgi:two-component sensor histidine kinase
MTENMQKTDDIQKKKNFGTSRLGLYIVLTGWLAFLVNISQVFQGTDLVTALANLLSFEPKHIPMRAISFAIPLILTIIGYLVYEREKYLGHVISTGRRLESKNISLETSYKKLYDKMKDGVAGSAHTVLLEESRIMGRGTSAVLSDMIDYRIRHLGDEAAHVLKEDRLRFRTMFLLQEALMKSSEPGAIDVRAYLNAVCRELMDEFHSTNVKLDLDIKETKMGINTLFPTGMIVCELVMNSLKHAFSETGEPAIRITLASPSKGQGVLWVMDNGKGILEGLDINAMDTMGFKMVNKMTRAMKARFSREQAEQGAAFSLTFSLSSRAPV